MNVRVAGHVEKENRAVDQIRVVSLREGQVTPVILDGVVSSERWGVNAHVDGHVEKENRVVDQIPVVSLREGQMLEAQVELLPASGFGI